MGKFAERLSRLWIRTKVSLGIPVPLQTPDREVLENVILPYYAELGDVRRVLFVGTAWYTAHYPRLMQRQEFWTLEREPSRRRYGSRHHIVDTLDQLGRHMAPGSLDLIVLNGVIGYGLDDPQAIEASIRAAHEALRNGGHLLLGWDDVDERRPVRPSDIRALSAFVPSGRTPFGGFRQVVEGGTRKTYDFYVKPA